MSLVAVLGQSITPVGCALTPVIVYPILQSPENKADEMLGIMTAKKTVLITLIALVAFSESAVQAYEIPLEEILANPTVTCKMDFTVDASLDTWNTILDNLYLMGALWKKYKFQPAYIVSRTESGLHVTDPTGIIGDIRQVGKTDISRTFYGTGKFDHWAIPSLFAADGVIIFEYKLDHNKLLGEVSIFLRGDNRISTFVMVVLSRIIVSHIDTRFKSNMRNVKTLIHEIVNEPDKVKRDLPGPLLDDFIRCFQS
jgi:hypothetical protein